MKGIFKMKTLEYLFSLDNNDKVGLEIGDKFNIYIDKKTLSLYLENKSTGNIITVDIDIKLEDTVLGIENEILKYMIDNFMILGI